MTRKDYELIAKAIESAMLRRADLVRAAISLARAFEQDNPKFNRGKFMTMCGVDR